MQAEGAPEGTRTPNLIVRSDALYPVELQVRVVDRPGFEPRTDRLRADCSAIELAIHAWNRYNYIRVMENIQSQIDKIQEEMAKEPYHKGTEGWFGLMRAKIAKLKAQLEWRPPTQSASGGKRGFGVRKFGDATVVLVGFPSVGKSTLLNALTNAKSPTAEYAFTTVTVIPGMMNYNSAQIQILDVPGLVEGAAKGRGRGREVLSVVRGADLLLIIVEVGKEEEQYQRITSELEVNGVRINQSTPQVVVKKTQRGGIKINFSVIQELDRETIIGVAKEFGVINGEITVKERLSLDRLVDVFATNRVYVPAIFVINKVDKVSSTPEVQVQFHLGGGIDTTRREIIGISAEKNIGLEELREKIWEELGLVRVYLRDPKKSLSDHHIGVSSSTMYKGVASDLEPMIMHIGENLQDLLNRLGQDATVGKNEAKIWGPGARFEGQTVSLSTKVQDGMEVTFV